ncbi:MAG: hypothetical protein Q8K60_08460, partial [Parachlamydiaceae bacterium]|nr:hypothetical protein [Parachlamydiaceae bacterium]
MNFKGKLIRLSLLNFLFLLSACQVGKRAEPIDLPNEVLNQAVKDNTNDLINPHCYLQQEWWVLFDDSQLNQF